MDKLDRLIIAAVALLVVLMLGACYIIVAVACGLPLVGVE